MDVERVLSQCNGVGNLRRSSRFGIYREVVLCHDRTSLDTPRLADVDLPGPVPVADELLVVEAKLLRIYLKTPSVVCT